MSEQIQYFNSMGSSVAYKQQGAKTDKDSGVSFIWLGGLHSSIENGEKLGLFSNFCLKKNWGLTAFDYFGHGKSEGQIEEGSIGVWLRNSLDVLDNLTSGPQILIGSSMGGWLALLLALNRPESVRGVFGINIAPDFTEDILKSFSYFQRIEMKGGKSLEAGIGFPVRKEFITEARKHLILNKSRISLRCPVHLFHGMNDDVVSYNKAIRVLKKVTSEEATLLLMRGVPHRVDTDTFERECVCRMESCVNSWFSH